MKNNKGITLIALVVTIIVLLILAGITIAALTGDNGIFGNAKKASAQTAYKNAKEQVRMAYNTVQTEIFSNTATDTTYNVIEHASDLKTIVDQNCTESGFSVSDATVSGTAPSRTATITITYEDKALKNDDSIKLTEIDTKTKKQGLLATITLTENDNKAALNEDKF